MSEKILSHKLFRQCDGLWAHVFIIMMFILMSLYYCCCFQHKREILFSNFHRFSFLVCILTMHIFTWDEHKLKINNSGKISGVNRDFSQLQLTVEYYYSTRVTSFMFTAFKCKLRFPRNIREWWARIVRRSENLIFPFFNNFLQLHICELY